MTLTAYWGSGSQPAWRVILLLEAFQIPYESKLLSFSKGEHTSPEFLRLNPRHKVPTIVDGDFALYESLAIMSYLDRRYLNGRLFGDSAVDAGLIQRHIAEFSNYVSPLLDDYVRPLFFGKSDEMREQVEASLEPLRAELATFEKALEQNDGPWLLGKQLSAADIYAFPSFMALERAANKPAAEAFNLGLLPVAEKFPALSAWMKEFEKLPGYQRAYPPHWKEG